MVTFVFAYSTSSFHMMRHIIFSFCRLTSVDDFEFISHSDLQPKPELVLETDRSHSDLQPKPELVLETDRSIPVDIVNQVKLT